MDEGDFELARPAAAGFGTGVPEVPGTREEAGPAGPVGPPAESGPAAPSEERSGPLHDPDPYDTPPYGEPGPWAPAPPVQHPALTPAPGGTAHLPPTAVAGPVPARGRAGLPGPAPAMAAGAPVPPAAPASAPGVPRDTPAPAAGTGAPAGPAAQLPPAPPAPAPAAPAEPPGSAHDGPVPHGAATVEGGGPPAPGHAPVFGGPYPHGTGPFDAGPAGVGSQDTGRTAAGEVSPGPGGPWQRYDPWATAPAVGALQQNGAGVATAEQRRRRVRRSLVGGAVALALLSGAVGGVMGAYFERNGGVGAVRLPQAGKEPAGRAPDSVAGIAARALPSVVTLHVAGSDEQGTGTGFVLDRLGHILTNNHVVELAASGGGISVTFSGGQTAKARIIGRDTGYDLAVVQVSGVRGLTPMPLGNSDNVQVGDPVVAIGAPFDLANTVTSGIISAKERPITAGGEKGDGSDVSYVDALQTDAPINPGNSGGPLLDSRGRVVGINSAIRSADTGSDMQTGQAGSIGLGFAIPVNQARRVAEELINTGRASHPVIGVTLDMSYTGDGARVGAKSRGGGSPVTPGGPGAKAGVKAGDVITAVDGRRVHSGEELIVRARAHRPGDRLELTIERGGKERRVSLVLGSSTGG
ncbi:trypsin-like peptidase domain-containing protein [Streptomyces sp. NPDC015220]|uniref:trypsin-like peptidase domain-containing protein n=1 Tax=Streptomyces sp. NPDC015220 TaxID=3364947 RepID=UPI003702E0C5